MDRLVTGEHDPAVSPLVVIGASAGGVDALMTLVASLSPEFPAPIVVAQHIERTRHSQLAEILGSRTALPVRTVTGREQLAPGTIFLVPANRDVEIDDHHVGTHVDALGPSRPSVDRLLATAARVYGNDLIAVILTGTGTDGALGAQAVKAYGGTVIVQNPETAKYSDMPSAVPPLSIDIVADLEAIGPLLGDLLSGAYVISGDESRDELQSFLDQVRAWSGLDFSAYKQPTITRRLQRRMAAVGTSTLAEYRRHVEHHPEELQRLVASFLIKVTDFFRDPDFFDHLRDQILPKLIAEARDRGSELRIWSAGCATGEEAYSLAMLVSDLLDGDTAKPPVRIFATDVAADAVEFGRRGVYPETALAGLPRDLVDRVFVQLDGVYEVRKPIRGLVVFGEHDLGHRAPFPRIDLVVCRNVLIYFTTELQRRALQLFAFSLRRGGYLALGKAESVSSLPQFFALEQPRLKIFRRVGELAPIPTNHVLDPLPAFRSTSSRRHGERRLAPESAPPTSFPLQQAHRLLDELTVGVITVDRGYNIRAINIAARRLLGVRSAALGDDLIHRLAPPLSTELRAAIDAALGGTPTTVTVQVPRDVVEGGRDIRITSSPVGDQDPGSVVGNVLIEVTLVTDLVQRQRAIAAERDQAVTANADMRADLDIAVAEVRELRAATETTAIVQSRLHSENEQLQLATEEAQAATEEIETLNEELQATNEELETLNEELQATVEELTTTNDELQAKSLELESLSSSLERQHRSSEDERTRLTAILANMGDAVLVLDAEDGIVLRNAAYERLFGTGTDFVPESEQGQPLPADEWPQARTARGETFTMQFTLANADGMRRWFEAKSQPVAATEGGRWSVIVFRDITERSLRRLQEEFLAIASHELRTPLTTLSGSLQLLQRRLRSADSDGRLNNLVERSLEQTRRLQQHIAELMDVARLQGGKLRLQREPFDLTALVRQITETADFLESEQTIQLTAPEHPIVINGDANRIQQVVFNLLTNAITHAAESKVIDLRLRQEPDAVILEVEDYGPGVPEAMTPLLFSRFFQAEERPAGRQGLGLGLYIAKEITEAHGGKIAVDSVVGQGTKFIIRLPTAAVSSD